MKDMAIGDEEGYKGLPDAKPYNTIRFNDLARFKVKVEKYCDESLAEWEEHRDLRIFGIIRKAYPFSRDEVTLIDNLGMTERLNGKDGVCFGYGKDITSADYESTISVLRDLLEPWSGWLGVREERNTLPQAYFRFIKKEHLGTLLEFDYDSSRIPPSLTDKVNSALMETLGMQMVIRKKE